MTLHSFKIMIATLSLSVLVACEHMPQELQTLPASISGFIEKQSSALTAGGSSPTASLAPKIEEVESANLKAWLIEDKTQPIFSVQIIFEGAGSASDPAVKQGRAMFAASLLDEGAGDMNALAFQKALKDKSIELSFNSDEDALVVNLKSLSANKEEAFRLLGLALTKPRFDADAVKRKRAQIFSALAEAESNPSYVLSKRFKEIAYPNHPYGRAEIGTKNTVTTLQASDFKAYTTNLIAKNNSIISVAGDIDAASLAILLDQYLGGLPKNATIENPVQPTSIHDLGRLEVIKKPIPQSMVVFATPAIGRQDPRFLAGYVLNEIIGGNTLTSKLGRAIREEKGLAYSVDTSLTPMTYSAQFGGIFATRNEQAHDAYQALLNVAQQIREQGITKEELAATKSYLTGAFSRSLDTNTALNNYMNIMQRYKLGKDYLEVRNAKIDAVTLEDVNALAKEWMRPENWLVVVVGSPTKLSSGKTVMAIDSKPIEQSSEKKPTVSKTNIEPSKAASVDTPKEDDAETTIIVP